MAELERARLRDCACPGTPHPGGDYVYLVPMLGIEGGMAAEFDVEAVQKLPPDRRGAALLARWYATFVRYGAVGWNLTERDPEGKDVPKPFDVDLLVNDYSLGRAIGDKANALYSEAVMTPLLLRAKATEEPSAPSPDGQTETSTFQPGEPTPKPPRSSSRHASAGQRSVSGP